MYHHRSHPLHGEEFRRLRSELPETARTSYDRLRQIINTLRPAKYVDELSSCQEERFSFVVDLLDWDERAVELRMDLLAVPLLSLAIQTNISGEIVEFVTISTFRGNVAVLALESISRRSGPFTKEEDALPADLRDMLQDPYTFVLVSSESVMRSAALLGLQLTSVVDAEDLFNTYSENRIIVPKTAPSVGDLTYQMGYAYNYHHRPTTQEQFGIMVGEHNYRTWPMHRALGWSPRCWCRPPNAAENYHFFCEATGSLGFIYRLMQHGLIYGGMKAVRPELRFNRLVEIFLQSNLRGQTRSGVGGLDPLGLQTDRTDEGEATAAASPSADSPYDPGETSAALPYSPSQPAMETVSPIDYPPEIELELHDDDIEQELKGEPERIDLVDSSRGEEVGMAEPTPSTSAGRLAVEEDGTPLLRDPVAIVQLYSPEESTPSTVRRMPGEAKKVKDPATILKGSPFGWSEPRTTRREVTFLEEIIKVPSVEASPAAVESVSHARPVKRSRVELSLTITLHRVALFPSLLPSWWVPPNGSKPNQPLL